jgi:starch phosphorylase
VSHVEVAGVGDAPELGQELEIKANVELGALTPDDVQVQVAFGAVDESDEIRAPQTQELERAEGEDGTFRYDGRVRLERRGAFGYTVRVLPKHPGLVSAADLDLVALPQDATGYSTV